MFRFSNYKFINPELAKYIKDSTNKSIENFKNRNKYSTYLITKENNPNPNEGFMLLPFVSLISFLAGYHFSNFLKK
jgi:hypothetical protein